MKDLIIINIYDGGYGFSVMVDGKISKRREFSWQRKTIADKIYEHFPYHKYEEFYEWLKNEYSDKHIIVCDDGDIEILKQKRVITYSLFYF